MGSSTYTDFDAIRRYMENMEQSPMDSYWNSFTNVKVAEEVLKKRRASKEPRNSFTNVNSENKYSTYTDSYSDSNNSENNPFTNVDSDYNKSENKYSTYTDSNQYSFTNENSANLNKNSGYFVYVESPLLWDEVTQTYRRNPKCNSPNPNKSSRFFTYADSEDSDDRIWPEEIRSSYWPK